MKPTQKLVEIRNMMAASGIDAYFIPMTDPHMGEYVPDRWKTIQWLTGFTGSAGNVIITNDFAGLWTDSRYFLQAEDQLKNSGFELVKLMVPHTPEFIDWLEENLDTGASIAFDSEVVSTGISNMFSDRLAPAGIKINSEVDLYSKLWTNRPPIPSGMIYEHDLKYAGLTRTEKLEQIREGMRKEGVSYHVLTSLDDIAWTFNIRGRDVNYSPLVIAYAVISLKDTWLFMNVDKIPELLGNKLLNDKIKILDYDWVYEFLKSIKAGSTVFISQASLNTRLYNSIVSVCRIKKGISIPTSLKSIKNSVELGHVDKIMVKDGVALSRFFYWLEQNIGKEKITELSASIKLEEFRMEQDNFMGPSFATIAGYKGHGAIIHYEPTIETDIPLEPDGIFLLDSGGQYLDGTTDTTRTVSLGNPGREEKRDFTLVLKGTIQLAMTRFPQGTKGYQIEAFARRALWDYGMNYGHGTGHGVGFFLNVHEGPQTIGSAASGNRDIPLEPGMLISDEPGVYKEGKYGMRTENLVVVEKSNKTEFGEFNKFKTVTLCYIDTQLVDIELLLPDEKEWLNEYHKRVFREISSFLNKNEMKWLEGKTQPV